MSGNCDLCREFCTSLHVCDFCGRHVCGSCCDRRHAFVFTKNEEPAIDVVECVECIQEGAEQKGGIAC